MDFAPSVCTGCARGCNVTTGARRGTFMRMEPRENPDVNRWWMCDAGRLDYAYANSETRFEAPRVRGADGALQTAGWDDAIVAAAAALKTASGDVLVDGGCTLEEMHLAKDVAAAMGGKAFFSAATGDADDFLVVAEKGANAAGADLLGLKRAKRARSAALLVVERDANVPAALRDGSGAVVVFATDGAHVPESAQVVFPLGSWAERDGLIVNTEGRVQALKRNPGIGPNLSTPCELLEEILGELDAGYAWRGREGVLAAIAALPAFAKVDLPVSLEASGVGAAS